MFNNDNASYVPSDVSDYDMEIDNQYDLRDRFSQKKKYDDLYDSEEEVDEIEENFEEETPVRVERNKQLKIENEEKIIKEENEEKIIKEENEEKIIKIENEENIRKEENEEKKEKSGQDILMSLRDIYLKLEKNSKYITKIDKMLMKNLSNEINKLL